MVQVSKREPSGKVKSQLREVFWQAIIKVTSAVDAERFIDDLLTETEKVMLAKRLAIVLLLERGYDYRKIRDVLKVSTSTIMTASNRLKQRRTGFRQLNQKLERDKKTKALLTKIGDIIEEMTVRPYSPRWTEIKRKQQYRNRNK